MNVDQSAAPSISLRASTVTRDSVEPGQCAMKPPVSVVRGRDTTTPGTPPSQTSVEQRNPASQIEHGDNLRNWRTIHEHVLCSHSQYMQQLSGKAELLRERYESCNYILESIESIANVGMTPEQFDKQELAAKLLSLMDIIEKYPMQEYQKRIDKVIGESLDQQFMNKNYLESESRPKHLKNFQLLGLKNRLSFLNAEGAFNVADVACMHLQRIKGMESQRAKVNVSKSWAQGRLVLRGATTDSVLSLVEWAYNPVLRDEDAEQLYDLWGLATRLKFEALAEECVNRLFNDASATIEHALSHGVPLRYLLGMTSEQDVSNSSVPMDETVATVFRNVLKDENAPGKLSNLVVETMARGTDSELWEQLGPIMNHNTARKLITAMVTCREVKVGQDVPAANIIKSESLHGNSSSDPRSTEPH
ncbi:hypothetical protein OPT61_g2745 [Boeremia exigua]|uniref:Uncharacterized protein n=1 Tax=Boeremia exigua TaxID=749465 RepID=A0ACC2IKD5_9PLEO|nr:hypothetical protein OPT61_g2745 [Boeremia exigua]